MKKLLALVILATFLTLVLPACGSINTATADQATPRPTVDLPTPDQLPNRYAKDPSRDDNLEKNDDPGPGTYADPSTLTWLKDLRCALRSDPIVLAEFLAYMSELDGFVNGATNDEAATIDSAAKLFIEDGNLRDRAIRKAFDLYGDKLIMPNVNMELLSCQVAELRAAVPLRSTDFSSYEEYEAYMERLRRLYAPSPTLND